MKIKEKYHGKVAVLDIRGDLMGGPDTQQIHEKVKLLLSEGFVSIVIDLGHVKWMNSSGLGVLMSCLTSTKEKEGRLIIANATEKVESLLMITQLTKVFHNYDSVDKAVASFSL